MAKKSFPSKYLGPTATVRNWGTTKEGPLQSHRKSSNALNGSSGNLALAVLVPPFTSSFNSIAIPAVTWEDDSASRIGRSYYYSFMFAWRKDGRVWPEKCSVFRAAVLRYDMRVIFTVCVTGTAITRHGRTWRYANDRCDGGGRERWRNHYMKFI